MHHPGRHFGSADSDNTAATEITRASATLNGTVNANGASTAVSFEYGLTTAYGNTVAGVPSPVTGNTVTPVTANITGLLPATPATSVLWEPTRTGRQTGTT